MFQITRLLSRKKEEPMPTAEHIMREIQKLSQPLAQEVLDFIGYKGKAKCRLLFSTRD